MLERAADNNAILLINFGPAPAGSIPDDFVANFRALAQRISHEGHPPLNKTTYPDARRAGATIDTAEDQQIKTARQPGLAGLQRTLFIARISSGSSTPEMEDRVSTCSGYHLNQ